MFLFRERMLLFIEILFQLFQLGTDLHVIMGCQLIPTKKNIYKSFLVATPNPNSCQYVGTHFITSKFSILQKVTTY